MGPVRQRRIRPILRNQRLTPDAGSQLAVALHPAEGEPAGQDRQPEGGQSEGEGFEAYTTPDLTIDTLNGLASLQKYPDADPDRIGMWGHSMGGNITLRAMVISDEIDAGVIWGGVVASYPDLFERWRRRDGDGHRSAFHDQPAASFFFFFGSSGSANSSM